MSSEHETVDEDNRCLLCGGDADRSDTFTVVFTCARCGQYRVDKYTGTCGSGEDLRPLSPVAREHWERNKEPLLITEKNVDDLKSLLPREHDVTDKTQRLLRALARQTEYPGHSVEIYYDKDYPLAYAANAGEFEYYCGHLVECGWIVHHGDRGGCDVTLTPQGWAEVERLRRTNVESEKVFVAMWFNEDMRSAYDDGIQAAI